MFGLPKLKLNVKNVQKTFLDCLLDNNYTDESKVIMVHAVTGCFGFDPEKIEKHSEDIHDMISQLHPNFDEKNQGYTFMNLPFKGENNEQWGEQRNGDQLMALGLASGWMKLTLEDKRLWIVLPGGVPYVYRLDKRADMSDKITTVGEAKTSGE